VRQSVLDRVGNAIAWIRIVISVAPDTPSACRQ
jgi:hypothetical protein